VSTVRWGLAGFGVGGRVFHAPMIASADGIDLVAVVSTNSSRAEEAVAAGYNVAPDVAGLVELGVEGVTITTPAGTHVPLAHEALDAGLHVVVDKPFALTAQDARGVVDHARRAGRTLSVYQNRRWDGDFLTVKAVVADGTIGTVRRFESRVERFRPELPAWITGKTSLEGGGTLVDLGPHLIDQAVQLFGPVATVFAELLTLSPTAGAEDDIRLMLGHASGVHSTIVASLGAAVEGLRLQVNGDRGGLAIRGFDIQERQLFDGGSPASLGLAWGREPDDRRGELVVVAGSTSAIPLRNGRWSEFYPALVAAVRTGAPVPVDPDDAVHVAEIFDAARKSSIEQRVVVLPT
jgi:predicted dehydrogenase